jgi:hypothetical protein
VASTQYPPANSKVLAALLDLKHLVPSLATRPIHISELVEYEPEMAGTCDASSAGAGGGVWIGFEVQPTMWRLEWPDNTREAYRQGQLINSDLEMVAAVLQYLVDEQLRLQYLVDEQLRPLAWSENTSPMSWSTKMMDKATTPIAGQPLWALTMWQCMTRVASPP